MRTTGRGRPRDCVCAECGNTFVTRGSVTRFCTVRCSAIASGRARRTAKGEIACARCGKTFLGNTVDWKGKPRRRYCSAYCYGLAIRKGGETFACEQCGSVRPVPVNAGGGHRYQQRFCSTQCANIAQGTGHVDRRGYRIFTISGRQVPEHRLVMERVLGRALFSYETVHHRDGVRTNNAPGNLEVWVGRHAPGSRIEDALAFAVTILTDHGYTVTPPASAGS